MLERGYLALLPLNCKNTPFNLDFYHPVTSAYWSESYSLHQHHVCLTFVHWVYVQYLRKPITSSLGILFVQ